MVNIHLDNIDRQLVNLTQVDFPLTREPYKDLGLRLDISEDQVLRRIEQLRVKGIIRQISPVFDARALGYQTTLVAIRVPEGQMDKAERLINQHPRVSHGYERAHQFNIWFTLAFPNTSDAETEVRRLTSPMGAEAVLTLPAVKVFKIGAYFDMDGDTQSTAGTVAQPNSTLSQKAELSQTDKLIINAVQQDLPLVSEPFGAIAAQLNMDVEILAAECRSLQQRGIMRRFGAAVNHNMAGFKANAMACWIASPSEVDIIGQKLSSLREVSHCYERKPNSLWPYNLFAVIHGRQRKTCQEIAAGVSRETGMTDYVLLFSTKEFKKIRVRYEVI